MTKSRLTRSAARRLLDVPHAHEGTSVGDILAAAAAPAEGTPSGEDVALAQFRAHAGRSTVLGGASPVVSTRRKIALPLATLAAVGAVAASGGVAFAASQGALHVPFTGHDNRSTHAPAAPAEDNPGLTKAETAGSDTADASDTTTAAPQPHPSAAPSPSLRGLCQAFQAGALHDGKSNPAFDALVKAAGGTSQVEAFCVTRTGTPRAHPTHPAKPAHPAKPTQAADPTPPVKPTQAADPTHPAKPTQAASPDKP